VGKQQSFFNEENQQATGKTTENIFDTKIRFYFGEEK